MLKKNRLILLFFFVPFLLKAQSPPAMGTFTKFVSKNFRLPEELKSNCEWMYAIVKVKTNTHNKVIKYEFVNHPPEGMKTAFNYLLGYQFPEKMKISGHPIVFYMGIDNLEGCEEKPGDKIFYAPNDAASTIWGYMIKLIKDDPETIIVPDLLISGYSKPQP